MIRIQKKYLIFLFFLFFFCITGFSYKRIKINSNYEEYIKNINTIIQYQNLYKNDDIIATISINDLNLKEIVAQTIDNSFYLNHNLKKEKDILGSTFLDYRNNLDDKKILIYGHNSQTFRTEFQKLEKYLEKEFYQKNNNEIILETIDRKITWKIFSVIIVTDDYQHMKLDFTEKNWNNHLKWLKDKSLYDTKIDIDEKDEILILQTCYYYPMDSFIIVSAKKIKEDLYEF